jgi:glycosyl hydrolase family 99
VIVAGVSVAASTGLFRSDPAKSLARVRVIVVGTAGRTDITIDGATLASYTSVVLDGADGSSASQTGSTLRTSNPRPGRRVEAQFDVVLTDVRPGAGVMWNLTAAADADTSIEIYSAADGRPSQLVDRFTARGAGQFRTEGSRLASDPAISVTALAPPLVLAHYYPWYTLDSWRNPELADQPAQLYSSDAQTDVDRQMVQAASAGIDAFVVSWQGRTVVEIDRRMRLVLDAAARHGMRACVFVETYIVNPALDANQPVDPATMVQWLEDAVDLYGSHPAYLRVNGRPVIFVYIAFTVSESVWSSVLAAVRRTGRNPIVIGDFAQSRLLNMFDGEFQYINLSPSPGLLDFYRAETLRVRTFNLVAGGPRRIWAASVFPGYDDSRLSARSQHAVADRAGGAAYEEQWRAAVSMAADWVVVATWNEFFENTHIEPSAKYGTAYLDLTRTWATRFKEITRLPHAAR